MSEPEAADKIYMLTKEIISIVRQYNLDHGVVASDFIGELFCDLKKVRKETNDEKS